MKTDITYSKWLLPFLLSTALTLGCGSIASPEIQAAEGGSYPVLEPTVHPRLLFSREELAGLRARAQSKGLAGEMWQRIVSLSRDWTMPGEWEKRGREMNAQALIYQVEGDRETGRQAVELFKQILLEIEPVDYYTNEVGGDFFETEHWPKAFAYGWDWLYELMTPQERDEILAALQLWAAALYEHTEANWWRNASINCGAIPVGALGLLCVSLQGDADHPQFDTWLTSSLHRIRDNYLQFTWRGNGICTEGPGYAHYHKNGTQFGEALRRVGGEDIVSESGAIRAMDYLRFQWLPQGGCGKVGDNTEYGRRVFQSVYLFGIGLTHDEAGLWTFEKHTARDRLDPILAFLWYPDHLEANSPGELDLPTSAYYEITPNQAGYVFSRSEWDNERAHWFNFVTRFGDANHQHYDMNSFLFTAFGEAFATHENIYPYSHPHHGADLEHNIIIVDEGGMPLQDRSNSAGDDCSLYGYLTGVGLGHFADYVRGDAKASYEDRSLDTSRPAVRADRYGVFVKQGPNPYVVMIDDFRQSETAEHDYHWQWFTENKEIEGKGTLDDPIVLKGKTADCVVGFLVPEQPSVRFEVIRGGRERSPIELGRIRATQRGGRVNYFAVGAAWEKGGVAPTFRAGPEVDGSPRARSLLVEGDGFTDLIIWQPEEVPDQGGVRLYCGDVQTDGLLSVLRLGSMGQVVGYVLGDGKQLQYRGDALVDSRQTWSVVADQSRLMATGGRRARTNQAPLQAAEGMVWIPDPSAQVFVDGRLAGGAEPDAQQRIWLGKW